MQKVKPCLWFNFDAEEAISFYQTIFKNFTVKNTSRYPEGGPAPANTLLVANVEIEGQELMMLNGGPGHPFTDAISLAINVESQAEIDGYWDKLVANGGRESQCGWLIDRYGLSWQIFPPVLGQLLADKDKQKAGRVMQAMMKMKKIIIADLLAAAKAA